MKPTPHPIRNDKTSHLMSVTRHAMTIGRVRRFGSNALSGHLAVLGLAAIMVLAALVFFGKTSVTIAGGAYHEVRRIFAALGSHVLSLCRVSFGALSLPQDLPAGSWRQITKEGVEPTP